MFRYAVSCGIVLRSVPIEAASALIPSSGIMDGERLKMAKVPLAKPVARSQGPKFVDPSNFSLICYIVVA